ncbi:hypothetical protein GQ53DRAFT_595207, partial [Thozetella sp. PMI_491]
EVCKFRLSFGDDLTEYQGCPSHIIDSRWNTLYGMGFSRVLPKLEAAQLPSKSMILPHEPIRQYVVGLDVFHQLHCLNTIRKSLSPRYYGPGGPGEAKVLEGGREFNHLDHCVNSIRQSLMRSPDIAALPWQWDISMQGRGKNVARATILHTGPKFDEI